MFYLASFDVTAAAFGTVTLATAGKTSVVVDLTGLIGTTAATTNSTKFFHYPTGASAGAITSQDVAAAYRLTDFSVYGFGTILQTALRAGATANSWTSPSGITVEWRLASTPASYRIAYPSATFSVTCSTALGYALMGFTGVQSGGTTYDGTVLPTYLIQPTLAAVSEPTTNYEPTGIANHITADDGTGYGIERYTGPLYRDWLQQFETKEKTIRLNAAAAHPWTFQALFEACRGSRPFMVLSGFGESFYEVFSFRSEGTQWHPERATPGNDSQFHIPFKCVVEGSVTAGL